MLFFNSMSNLTKNNCIFRFIFIFKKTINDKFMKTNEICRTSNEKYTEIITIHFQLEKLKSNRGKNFRLFVFLNSLLLPV